MCNGYEVWVCWNGWIDLAWVDCEWVEYEWDGWYAEEQDVLEYDSWVFWKET